MAIIGFDHRDMKEAIQEIVYVKNFDSIFKLVEKVIHIVFI